MKYKYLQPEDIRKLKSFEFAPRLLAQGYLSGRHLSRKPGASTDFKDYRQYAPGDDPVFIDWRVYARTDRFYIRRYERESCTDCHIFLDSSNSMGFGKSLTKLEYASFFAAALCYLIVKNNDLVSLLIFDEKIRHFFPPASTWRHLQGLMHCLEDNSPGNETSLSNALGKAFPLLRRTGTLIVISDFFDNIADIFSALNPYLHQGFDIRLFHILASEEIELEDKGLTAYIDAETRERVVGHGAALRSGYSDAMRQHIDAMRSLCMRKNVDYTLARTSTHYFELFDRLVR